MNDNTENLSVERFNAEAARWDESPTKVDLAHAIAEALVTHVPLYEGMDALEYGCGTGLVTLAVAHRFRNIVALDNAWNMLEVLTEKIKERQIHNVTTCYCDLLTEALTEKVAAPQHFHLAYSSMTLHHIADAPALLRALAQSLHPGGYLAIADLEQEDGSFHPPDVAVPHHGFARETLSSWFEHAGLMNTHCITAHTVSKTDDAGTTREYPILLMIGQRPLTE
jgi:ubiquinone/menaquinone biosynthesis C-methylase UbiE